MLGRVPLTRLNSLAAPPALPAWFSRNLCILCKQSLLCGLRGREDSSHLLGSRTPELGGSGLEPHPPNSCRRGRALCFPPIRKPRACPRPRPRASQCCCLQRPWGINADYCHRSLLENSTPKGWLFVTCTPRMDHLTCRARYHL